MTLERIILSGRIEGDHQEGRREQIGLSNEVKSAAATVETKRRKESAWLAWLVGTCSANSGERIGGCFVPAVGGIKKGHYDSKDSIRVVMLQVARRN
jgi:hypothetical protein